MTEFGLEFKLETEQTRQPMQKTLQARATSFLFWNENQEGLSRENGTARMNQWAKNLRECVKIFRVTTCQCGNYQLFPATDFGMKHRIWGRAKAPSAQWDQEGPVRLFLAELAITLHICLLIFLALARQSVFLLLPLLTGSVAMFLLCCSNAFFTRNFRLHAAESFCEVITARRYSGRWSLKINCRKYLPLWRRVLDTDSPNKERKLWFLRRWNRSFQNQTKLIDQTTWTGSSSPS